MYMYVNKRVELAQWGIALKKIYVIIIIHDFGSYIDLGHILA